MSNNEHSTFPDTPTIVHIGIGKAASTSIQTFFENHNAVSNLARPFIDQEHRNLYSSILKLDRQELDFEKVRTQIQKKYDKFPNALCKFISNESFSSSPWPTEIAYRIQQIYPNAKILIIIRNQTDAIKSYYFSHGRTPSGNVPRYMKSHKLQFSEWLDDNLFRLENNLYYKLDHQYFKTINYKHLILPYLSVFGKSSVRVMLFEEMVNSPATFFNSLFEYLGIDYGHPDNAQKLEQVNQRGSHFEFQYDAIRSKLPFKGISNFIPFFQLVKGCLVNWSKNHHTTDVKLSSHQLSRIEKLYAEPNSWAQAEFKLNMENNGYFLIPNSSAHQSLSL